MCVKRWLRGQLAVHANGASRELAGSGHDEQVDGLENVQLAVTHSAAYEGIAHVDEPLERLVEHGGRRVCDPRLALCRSEEWLQQVEERESPVVREPRRLEREPLLIGEPAPVRAIEETPFRLV